MFSVSASHTTADFATLERLSATVEKLPSHLLGSLPGVRGSVVLATCNRFEAYLDLESSADGRWVSAVAAVVETIAEASGMSPRELRDTLAFKQGPAAVQHLFAVASGLESVVVGEDEITGQVRRALEHAQHDGGASPALETLFQRALEASKAVKNSADRGAAGRSIVGVALDMASTRVRDWATTRVLLVGTGAYAGAAVGALQARGVTDIRVHSVSGGGTRFAERHDLPLVQRASFALEAATADVVLCCTTSTHVVLQAATLMAGRGSAPGSTVTPGRLRLASTERAVPSSILVIDLGLPRNVDPDVAALDGVSLIDLETIRLHAPIDNIADMSEAEALVFEASQRFTAAERVRDVAPALVALRQHVLDLVDTEVARAQKRADFNETTEEALRHLGGVLLHQPMTRSRELADQGQAAAWLDGLVALFGIDPGAPPVDRPAPETSVHEASA